MLDPNAYPDNSSGLFAKPPDGDFGKVEILEADDLFYLKVCVSNRDVMSMS